VEQGRQSAPCADQLDVGEPFRLVLFVVGLTLGRAELYRVALGVERLRRVRLGFGCRFLLGGRFIGFRLLRRAAFGRPLLRRICLSGPLLRCSFLVGPFSRWPLFGALLLRPFLGGLLFFGRVVVLRLVLHFLRVRPVPLNLPRGLDRGLHLARRGPPVVAAPLLFLELLE
jgi:hypothetical protein